MITKFIRLVILLSVCANVYGSSKGNPIWNATHIDNLKKSLLLNYDKFARPAQHYNVTRVNVRLTTVHLDLDEIKSIFTVHLWLALDWVDEKLQWNPSDFGDLELLHLGVHELWQPDLVCYNSATGNSVDHYGNTYVLVKNTGYVLWVPPTLFTTFCNLNLKHWPFDVQHCKVKFGSWTYDGYKVDLKVTNENIDIEMHHSHSQWKVLKATQIREEKTYPCCEEPYINILASYTLARNSPFLQTIVVSPLLVIVILTLIIFWLPPDSGEKLILNGSIFLLVSLFLLFFFNKLPLQATEIPLIVVLYLYSLFAVCFSTIISIIVLKIGRKKHDEALPKVIRQFVNSKVGQIFRFQFNNKTNSIAQKLNAEEATEQVIFDELPSSDQQIQESKLPCRIIQQEWINWAITIDRISFLIYIIAFISLAYTCGV